MEKQEMEALYNEAKNIYLHNFTEERITKAMKMFESLGDYKNSPEMVEKCRHFFDYDLGKIVTFGKFEGKDLKWKVIEVNGSLRLLFAVEPITHRSYNVIHENTYWSDADLRNWLNFKFVNEAFSIKERMNIIASERENNSSIEWSTQNGNPTRDKVFVLSHEECMQYLPEKEDRAIGEWWWLRNKGHSLLTAECVYADGSIYTLGLRISDPEIAVRPAMYVKVAK